MLPESFIKQIFIDFPALAPQIVDGYEAQSPTSIRLNPSKIDPLSISFNKQIPWEPLGRYVNPRPVFTADPLFHSGVYYVQEASSMFVGAFLRELIQKGIQSHRVLDVSAAPGGKTTHLASILPAESVLVANDINRSRALILRENVAKWGSSNVVVTNNEPADFARLTHFFDVIVLDAPCSGEGMFRKDPHSISEWSVNNVLKCAKRQDEILHSVWPALKLGGLLIYSTCTLNTKENEEVLNRFLKVTNAEWIPFERATDYPLHTLEGQPYYRCLPGLIDGEGFSFGCIKKTSDTGFDNFATAQPKKNTLKPLSASHKILVDGIADKPVDWFLFGDSFLAVPAQHTADIQFLTNQLRVVKAGVIAGELKGNEMRPHQEWSLSDLIKKNSYPSFDLSYEQALAYLRRDELWLETGIKKGYILLTYNHIPLGFAKIAGNRINNLYPVDWRIRMQLSENQKYSLTGL